MTHISASDLKSDADDLIRRVAEDGEPIVVQVNGQDKAALVSMSDLALLEETENRLDLEAYRQAKKEFEQTGRESIPYEVIRKELGLE